MELLANTAEVNYVSVGSAIGSVGFAIWYGWFVTTRTIPKIIDDHRNTNEKMASDHKSIVDRLVTEFREEQREERRCFTETLRTISDKFVCSPVEPPGRHSWRGPAIRPEDLGS